MSVVPPNTPATTALKEFHLGKTHTPARSRVGKGQPSLLKCVRTSDRLNKLYRPSPRVSRRQDGFKRRVWTGVSDNTGPLLLDNTYQTSDSDLSVRDNFE